MDEPPATESLETKWWRTYAEQLEREYKHENAKKHEAEVFGITLLVGGSFVLALVFAYARGWEDVLGDDFAWWAVLLYFAVAPLAFTFLFVPVVILASVVGWLLRPRWERERDEALDRSRMWAWRVTGRDPSGRA